MRVLPAICLLSWLAGCGVGVEGAGRVECDLPNYPDDGRCALSVGQQAHGRLDRYREWNEFRILLPPNTQSVELTLEAAIEPEKPSPLQVTLTTRTADRTTIDEASINDTVPSGLLDRRIDTSALSELWVSVDFGGMTRGATYTLSIR